MKVVVRHPVNEQMSTYRDRMMSVFERACNLEYKVTIHDGMLVVKDPNEFNRACALTLDYTHVSLGDLDYLETCVRYDELEQEKTAREHKAHPATLVELNSKERKLLGL